MPLGLPIVVGELLGEVRAVGVVVPQLVADRHAEEHPELLVVALIRALAEAEELLDSEMKPEAQPLKDGILLEDEAHEALGRGDDESDGLKDALTVSLEVKLTDGLPLNDVHDEPLLPAVALEVNDALVEAGGVPVLEGVNEALAEYEDVPDSIALALSLPVKDGKEVALWLTDPETQGAAVPLEGGEALGAVVALRLPQSDDDDDPL